MRYSPIEGTGSWASVVPNWFTDWLLQGRGRDVAHNYTSRLAYATRSVLVTFGRDFAPRLCACRRKTAPGSGFIENCVWLFRSGFAPFGVKQAQPRITPMGRDDCPPMSPTGAGCETGFICHHQPYLWTMYFDWPQPGTPVARSGPRHSTRLCIQVYS